MIAVTRPMSGKTQWAGMAAEVTRNWGYGYVAATVRELNGGATQPWILSERLARKLGCRIPPPVDTHVMCGRGDGQPVAARAGSAV